MISLRLRAVAAAAFLVMAVLYAAFSLAPSDAPAATTHTAPRSPAQRSQSYPHLANYNGLRDVTQVPFYAAYGLVIARRGAPIRQLKRANPQAIALLYERTLQADLCCTQALYGLRPAQVPPQWWLLTAGSRLGQPISAHQTWFAVADPRPFSRCQDVLVDGESMHVWGVSGHLLHVWRGYYSRAAAHAAGAYIAPHYSYRSDLSNCHVQGPVYSMRPWSFNLAATCPRWHGLTWADYLARRVAAVVRREGWDGIFYDNLTDFPASPLVDVNADGRADGGIVGGINVWRVGERALLATTRRLLPGARVTVNGDLLIDGLADGREMEGFPLIPGSAVSAAIDSYLYDGAHGAPLSIVNPDSVTRPIPSMPAVQLAVAASLLGDGYATYDQGWLDHGAPWWFDEFDGGVGSATLQPLPVASMLVPVAHARRFHRGDIVLLDHEAVRVLQVLDSSLLVQRAISGTVATWHMQRDVMTTPAQRRHADGYLGTPLGPARLVPTGIWNRYILPLTLVRGPSSIDEGPRQGPSYPISTATTLEVTSTLHYDSQAVSVTLQARPSPRALRTLVFTARGPQGQSLWLSDGAVSVPLVLRGNWHRYVVPVGGSGRTVLGFGRINGRVEIKEMQLVGVQAYVLRRDFTHGIVVVNPTDIVQRLPLEQPYRILSGDQNPWANSGRITRRADVARYRALILLRP